MTKKQLEKIWKQLDGCCEALERLEEIGFDMGRNNVDFSSIVSLKNRVEEEIEMRTRKK